MAGFTARSRSPRALTFHGFPKLPQELQDKIWKYSCENRIITLIPDPDMYEKMRTLQLVKTIAIQTKQPAVLHVSKNSRAFALRFLYQLMFADLFMRPIYFNPDYDTIMMSHKNVIDTMFISQGDFKPFYDNVKHLVIGPGAWPHLTFLHRGILAQCLNMETLTLTMSGWYEDLVGNLPENSPTYTLVQQRLNNGFHPVSEDELISSWERLRAYNLLEEKEAKVFIVGAKEANRRIQAWVDEPVLEVFDPPKSILGSMGLWLADKLEQPKQHLRGMFAAVGTCFGMNSE